VYLFSYQNETQHEAVPEGTRTIVMASLRTIIVSISISEEEKRGLFM
jgi:hypothetical protein